jgi:hypothetical protein
MSILKSVFLGSEGSYKILGIDVQFQKNHMPNTPSVVGAITPESYLTSQAQNSNIFVKSLGYVADKLLKSNAFKVITQAPMHAFVHEMGHALAAKMLLGDNARVFIYTDLGAGDTFYANFYKQFSAERERSIICAAGPMADMIFSSCELVGAVALRNYLSTPVAVTLGAGAVIWMTGELFLAYISASNNTFGDFGIIARNGATHLAIASAALVGQCALGVFAACQFL